MSSDSPVTLQDIEALNRASVERTAVITRLAAAVLIGAGVLGLVGWLWVMVRAQQEAESFVIGTFDEFESGDPSVVTRVDTLAATLTLMLFAAILVGLGVGLRLAADYAQTRVGGSVTGFRVGDAFPVDENEGDDED